MLVFIVRLTAFLFVSTEILEDPEDILEGFVIKNDVCSIRDYDPFDMNVDEFIFDEKKPICNAGKLPLIRSNLTSIFIVEELFTLYEIYNTDLFRCCFKKFGKEEARLNEDDDNRLFYNNYNCTYFEKSAMVFDQFIKVLCFYNTRVIYVDYVTFMIYREKQISTNDKLNVLMIGLDGISRLNFRRQMSKTASVLAELGAVELLGYHKVADNTFPNIMAVLTGFSEEEDLKFCWPHFRSYLDNCPFIWKLFKTHNFTTAYGEDWHYDRSTFRTGKKGFRFQPTDYYYRTFAKATKPSEEETDECLGSREGYEVLLEFLEKFVDVMHNKNERYFGFFWENSLSHDLLNKPKLGDDDYKNLFNKLNQTGILNNTVMIVMSDHGLRYGPMRSTSQGYIEDRLPLLWIYLPNWYRETFPTAYSNLVRNRRRLTTHFDLHITLLDLLEPYKLPTDLLNKRLTNNQKALSLFGEIPKDRTCEMAGLSPNWCACQLGDAISTTDEFVYELARMIVSHVNNLLKNHNHCEVLRLVKVINARQLLFSFENRYYTVTLRVNPSQAILQGVVNEQLVKRRDSKLQIVGRVTRLNKYGNQSDCVDDYRLKMYCFC